MEQLIKIEEKGNNQVVSARELHSFLDSKQDFTSWIKYQIDRCMLLENNDFEVYTKKVVNLSGGRPSVDYAVTLSAAKEIAMVNGGEKGKKARLYFIECEKKAKEIAPVSLPKSYKEALQHLLMEVEKRELAEKALSDVQPALDSHRALISSEGNYSISNAAKIYGGIGQNRLFEILRKEGVLMSVGKDRNIPYQKFIDQGYFIVRAVQKIPAGTDKSMTFKTTYLTPKGLDGIRKSLIKKGYLKN